MPNERARVLLLFICAVWCSSFIPSVGAAPSPPDVPGTFEANTIFVPFGFHFNIAGVLSYDRPAAKLNYTLTIPVMQYTVNYQIVATNVSEHVTVNDQCRNYMESFSDWFSWVKYATYAGSVPCANGTDNPNSTLMCDRWVLTVHDKENVTRVLVLENIGNVPVLFATYTQDTTANVTIIFKSFEPGAVTIGEATCPPPTQCPDGDVESMMMTRFHAAGDYELSNQNTGDVAGDTFFICSALVSGSYADYSQVSTFLVEVNTRWGQYALCNFGECVGGDNETVGREAPSGLFANGGQCAANADTGSWYSLRNASECKDARSVVGSDCAWRSLGRKKSVALRCLLSHGLMQACQRSARFPLSAATAIVEAAIRHTDHKKGGCPDVGVVAAAGTPTITPSSTSSIVQHAPRTSNKAAGHPKQLRMDGTRHGVSRAFDSLRASLGAASVPR